MYSAMRAYAHGLPVVAFGLACAAAFAPTARAQTAATLFFIERSKNANIVLYDAHVGPNGTLDADQPVVGYWIMKAEDSRHEDLTFMERKMAYGFDVEPGTRAGTYTMRLVSFKERALTLLNVAGRWRAKVMISGKPAFLKKLYIASDEHSFTPTVLYVDLYGEDDTGTAVQEHIIKH
jgi:hypothetical protein